MGIVLIMKGKEDIHCELTEFFHKEGVAKIYQLGKQIKPGSFQMDYDTTVKISDIAKIY